MRGMIPVAALATALLVPVAQAGEDPRQPIELEAPQRAAVLGEMRQFVEAIDTILDATLAEDMERVARAAKPMGMAAVRRTPEPVRQALPGGFMQMGRGTHQAFEAIARDAEALGDPRHTLEQLSRATSSCVACHRSYRIVTAD